MCALLHFSLHRDLVLYNLKYHIRLSGVFPIRLDPVVLLFLQLQSFPSGVLEILFHSSLISSDV